MRCGWKSRIQSTFSLERMRNDALILVDPTHALRLLLLRIKCKGISDNFNRTRLGMDYCLAWACIYTIKSRPVSYSNAILASYFNLPLKLKIFRMPVLNIARLQCCNYHHRSKHIETEPTCLPILWFQHLPLQPLHLHL